MTKKTKTEVKIAKLVFKSGGILVWKSTDYVIYYSSKYSEKDVIKFADFVLSIKKSHKNINIHIIGDFVGDLLMEKMQKDMLKAGTMEKAEEIKSEMLCLFEECR